MTQDQQAVIKHLEEARKAISRLEENAGNEAEEIIYSLLWDRAHHFYEDASKLFPHVNQFRYGFNKG